MAKAILPAIVAVAAMFAPAAASAQAGASADARATVIDSLSLVKIQDFDFGDIVAPGLGTVTLTPSDTNPSCVTNNNLVHSGVCQPAQFGGTALHGTTIRINKPPLGRFTITGPGRRMTVNNITFFASSDLRQLRQTGRFARYRVLSVAGNYSIWMGGRLNVRNNQAPGEYSGTFEIDVSYD